MSAKNVVLQPGADRRQLVGDDQGVDRRHRRLHPGRPRRATRAPPRGPRSSSCAARTASGRPSSAARTATRTGPPCPRTRRRRSRCRCTRVTASCAAATRSTTARPGPRSATASTPAGSARRASAWPPTTAPAPRSARSRRFTVGEPPELPPVAAVRDAEHARGRLHDAVRRHRRVAAADWQYAGAGRFVRDGCTIKSVGGFGLMYTKQDYKAPVLAQARVDDARRRQLRRLRRLPRHRGRTPIRPRSPQGEEIQIDPTDNPAQTTGAIYLEQAADAAARDAALKPAGQWNAYEIVVRKDRIIVFLNGVKINEWIDDDPNVDLATGPHRPADARRRATTCTSATSASSALERERRRGTARSAGRCRRRCR